MLNAEVRKQGRHSALICAGFLALAIAWTWPLVTRLASRVPHDPGDPILNTWILWWNTQAVPFTEAWWSPPIFYPLPGAFALSEHLAGIALFTAPFQLAGLPPLAAYNIALILSGWLSGYFAFLLARRLTGSTFAGVVGGVAFAIAPYRASQLSHLQVLTSQWMPLALLAMHAWIEEGRRRWLALFAAAWLLQALSNGYYLLFFPILFGLWLLWFVDWRREWRRGGALAATFGGASVLLLPLLLRYREVHRALDLTRSISEMAQFSAAATSFIQPAYLLTFWPSLADERPEAFLFPGVTVVAVVLASAGTVVMRRRFLDAVQRRSAGVFYALSAVVFWWLCFGPSEDSSVRAWIEHPYTVLTLLPGFEGLRVPARFAMLATLSISIGAAIGVARLRPRRRTLRIAGASLVMAGLLVDGWIDRLPLSAPPGRALLSAPADSAVIELPMDDEAVSMAAMYRSITHHRPLVNGYSGHTPRHYEVMSWFLKLGDPTVLQHFARGRSLTVVVHRDRDPRGDWRNLVQFAGGVLEEETGIGSVFRIPPQPRPRVPAIGERIDTIFDDRGDDSSVDLGAEQLVRAVTIPLRRSFSDIEARLTVSASSDGVTWTSAWEGWIGEAALIGALTDAHSVPMTIYLPDVRARYLRVTPTPAWVARDLTVFAPK